MDEIRPTTPYKLLGRQLRSLRQRAQETLAEASGAVEIEVAELAKFELGKARPGEEVLLLLISHFGVADHEAVKLWELAGFNAEKVPMVQMTNNDTAVQSSDGGNIIFTDTVDIIVNNYGVVMNFMQGGAPSATPKSIARVGMSREHAKSILQILRFTLEQSSKKMGAHVTKKIAAPKKPGPNSKN